MTTEKETQEVQQFKLRIPRSEYEALRVVAFATDRSINEVVQSAIHDWLSHKGRRQQVSKLIEETIGQYKVALDKLADS